LQIKKYLSIRYKRIKHFRKDNKKKEICFLKEGAVLEQIRKITALGVACMENNDTKARK